METTSLDKLLRRAQAMANAIAPRPRGRPTGRDGFVHVLRAELARFRAVRARMITLLLVVAAFVLVSFLSACASHETNLDVPTGPGGEAVTDTYTFVHQTLVGNGTLTVRVASLSVAYTSTSDASGNTVAASSKSQPGSQREPGLAAWAKAGILLEPDTAQGTDYAAVMATGSHGVRMQYDYTHDSPGLAGTSSPRWLRLTRVRDVIAGYDSTDGAHWSEIGTARLSGLPQAVQVGLFVASPDYFATGTVAGTSSLATATFDHTSTQGDLPGHSWTTDPIGDASPNLPPASAGQQQSAGLFTVTGSGDIAPLVGGEDAATHWAGASIVNGTIVALLIAILFATLFATAEYRHELVRATVTALPRRTRLLAATAVVAGSLAFTAGATATVIAEAITRHVLAVNGNYLFPQSGPTLARVIIGTGLLLGLAAVLAVALGTIVRRSAAAIAAGIVLLILPGVLATATPLAASSGTWLMRLTPTAAFAIQATLPRSNLVAGAYVPANGYFPISPWAGLAVLAAYTALAMSTAMWLLHRKGHRLTSSGLGVAGA